MPHVKSFIMIDASPLLVKKIYMDYAHWNQLFPLTIKATSFVKEENGKLTVMADHKLQEW